MYNLEKVINHTYYVINLVPSNFIRVKIKIEKFHETH